MEIYIKPGSAAVNLIASVGSAKETVVPAAERKIVFGGIESLFSFHKESFLPALEQAAAPLIKSAKDADVDGKLSMDVARNVGNIFVRHAAFMKMYSTYIKYVGLILCLPFRLTPIAVTSTIQYSAFLTGRRTRVPQGRPPLAHCLRHPALLSSLQ